MHKKISVFNKSYEQKFLKNDNLKIALKFFKTFYHSSEICTNHHERRTVIQISVLFDFGFLCNIYFDVSLLKIFYLDV